MAKSGCVCCKISNLTDSARRSGARSEVSIARQHIDRLKRYEGIDSLCDDHMVRRKPFVMMVEHWLDRVVNRGPERRGR